MSWNIVGFSIVCEFLPSVYYKLKHSGKPDLHSVHHAALFNHLAFLGGGGAGRLKTLQHEQFGSVGRLCAGHLAGGQRRWWD